MSKSNYEEELLKIVAPREPITGDMDSEMEYRKGMDVMTKIAFA